jgi:hypothetical protein
LILIIKHIFISAWHAPCSIPFQLKILTFNQKKAKPRVIGGRKATGPAQSGTAGLPGAKPNCLGSIGVSAFFMSPKGEEIEKSNRNPKNSHSICSGSLSADDPISFLSRRQLNPNKRLRRKPRKDLMNPGKECVVNYLNDIRNAGKTFTVHNLKIPALHH